MTKHELKQILVYDALINTKLKQLAELKSQMKLIKSFDYSKDFVQESNRSGSKIEDLVIRIEDKQREINRDIDRLVDLKSDAEKQFRHLEPEQALIMNLRYLECLSWDDVAERTHFSLRHVYRIHGEALQELSEKKL